MTRLRRVDCGGRGLRRRRHGRGFVYLDEDGERIDGADTLERVRGLAIPPAWEEVWICPLPNGHIQATGIDAAGRKQYRYHDLWRSRRDAAKFESMVQFAERLPAIRDRVDRDLACAGMPRERALACAVRLLDRGSFRIGLPHLERDGVGGDRARGLRACRSRVEDRPQAGLRRRSNAQLDPSGACGVLLSSYKKANA